MARIDTLTNFLTDIANKIRSKNGTNSNITPANYDTEIEKIGFEQNALIFFNTNISTSLNFKPDSEITLLNLKNLDTTNFTTMQQMFSQLTALEELDLSNFKTSNVKNMSGMFQNCKALTKINVSSFNTSSVTSMTSMFNTCIELTELDLSSFNTNNVTNFATMFRRCDKLETITFGNSFTFSGITASQTNALNNMFQNCTKLDNNTLNQILYLCTTATSYAGTKTLAKLGIDNTFDNFSNISNLSNYTAFTNAGWTIS